MSKLEPLKLPMKRTRQPRKLPRDHGHVLKDEISLKTLSRNIPSPDGHVVTGSGFCSSSETSERYTAFLPGVTGSGFCSSCETRGTLLSCLVSPGRDSAPVARRVRGTLLSCLCSFQNLLAHALLISINLHFLKTQYGTEMVRSLPQFLTRERRYIQTVCLSRSLFNKSLFLIDSFMNLSIKLLVCHR